MNNNYAIIIPTTTKNRHFDNGDFNRISGQSLVTWKLNRMDCLFDKFKCYLLVDEVIDLDQKFDGRVEQILRTGKSVTELISLTSKLVKDSYIIWLNCNIPFLRNNTILEAVEALESDKSGEYDSLVSVSIDNNYYFYNNTPLNFSLSNFISRSEINPLIRVNNALYIFRSQEDKKSLFGNNPYLHEISDLEAYEVSNSISENEIRLKFYNFLISN
jgi:hypothetical protein